MNPLFEQRPESHGLTQRPIDRPRFDHLHPRLQDPLDALVNDELGGVRRRRREPLPDVDQSVLLDAGRTHLERILPLEESRPGAVQPVLVLDVGLLAGALQRLLADLLVLGLDVLHLFGRHDALFDQLFGVLLQGGLGVPDLAVHQRLREHRLVDLVVAVAPIADDVDDDVLVEGGPPLGRHVAHVHHALGVVRVHVEDGRVDDARDI